MALRTCKKDKTFESVDGHSGTGRKCLMLGCILTCIVWIVVVVTQVSLDVPANMALGSIDTYIELEHTDDIPHKEINIRGNSFRFPEGIRFTRMQKVAMLSENDSESTVRREYESLVERLGVKCGQHVRMGIIGDGGWDVCISPPYNIKPPCLVYDFGIAKSWSFDDAITQIYNCTLRAFDPTNGLDEHNRSEKIKFYPVGLSGAVGIHRHGFPVTTLKALLERFSETRMTIDYLKIDVESSEWDALPTMLSDGSLAGVKQIGIEVHVWPTAKASFVKSHIDLLDNMTSAGFRLWKSDWNKHTIRNISGIGQRPICHEIYFLNINLLKLS